MLTGYAAFWHNDKPWGFGASLYRPQGHDSTQFFDTFYHEAEKLGKNLHEDSTMTVEEARYQLKHLAAQYKQLGDVDEITDEKVALLMLMFGNVKFLTLRDAIANNEYNGLQYLYANF